MTPAISPPTWAPTEMKLEKRERDDQVQHDQTCDLAAGRDMTAPLQHEEPAEDPEDRALTRRG